MGEVEDAESINECHQHRPWVAVAAAAPNVTIETRDAGSTRGARSRGTSWQTSADTIDVPTIIYGIYI